MPPRRSSAIETEPTQPWFRPKSAIFLRELTTSRPGPDPFTSKISYRHKHRLQQVSRVHAVLALDHGSHVTCTGYVEHGVDTADDPDIQAVRKICLSMHKHNVRE